MKAKFDYEQVNVGISYNKKNGGAAADSIKKIITDLGLNLNEVDYRAIVPVLADDIIEDKYKLFAVINDAKINARHLLKNLDGIIIPGSDARLDPRLYNEPFTAHSDRIDLARSIAELAQLHVAMQGGMPILGICGGHQIINVYLGGTLKSLSEEDMDAQGFMCYSQVGFNPKTEIAKIFFEQQENREVLQQLDIYAHSFFGAHKHAINRVGNKELANKDQLISVVAIADDAEHTIEGLESNYGAPLYSVQFHPEVGVKGMYSQLRKTTAYQAATEQDIQINAKLFEAFKQAMLTFHLKKSLISTVKQEETLHQAQNAEQISQPEEEESSIIGLDVYSMFREAKSKSSVDEGRVNDNRETLDLKRDSI